MVGLHPDVMLRLRSSRVVLGCAFVAFACLLSGCNTKVASSYVQYLELANTSVDIEKFGDSPCDPDLRIPNPFHLDALWNLYDDEGTLAMKFLIGDFNLSAIAKTWKPFSKKVFDFGANCEDRRVLQNLLDDGLEVTPFGMSFSKVQAKRYGSDTALGNELVTAEDVARIRSVYFDTRIHNFMWEVDVPLMYRSTFIDSESISTQNAERISHMRSHGFVKFDKFVDINVDDLRRETTNLLYQANVDGRCHKNSPMCIFGADVQAALPLIKEGSDVWKIVLAYFGGQDVRYNGMQIMHLRPSANKLNHHNSPWHHDGCGNRLKLFVNLEDVDSNSNPTLVIPGTHRMQYFPPTHLFAGIEGYNKLNDTLIRQVYGSKIAKMTGRVGGGFLFDTNAIHGADTCSSKTKGCERRDRINLLLDFGAVAHQLGMPRQARGPDDGFMSAFPKEYCPSGLKGGRPLLGTVGAGVVPFEDASEL